MGFRKYNFFKKFLDFLTGFLAFLTVLLMLFNLVCAKFGILPDILPILATVQTYLLPILIVLVGLEWFSTKNLVLLILYVILALIVLIGIFQPAWIDAFIGLFKKG